MADNTEKGAEAAVESEQVTEDATEVPDSFKAIVLGGTGATGRYLVGELLSSKVNYLGCAVLHRHAV